jgi:hypothetical protein
VFFWSFWLQAQEAFTWLLSVRELVAIREIWIRRRSSLIEIG